MGRVLLALIIVLIVAIPTVKAAVESVYVDLFFNIGAVDELSVTLLGQSPTSSSGSGQAAPANIEFNVSSGSFAWQNATVTGTASEQDGTTPILALDNVGTTDLQIDLILNASLPSATCTMLLRYIGDQYAYDITTMTPESDGTGITEASNVTVDASFEPPEAAWGIWLYGNFTDCSDNDDTVRRLIIYATTV